MTTFLTQCPWVSEFEYKWNIPIILRSIMLADVTRADYSKKKKNKEETEPQQEVEQEQSLGDFLSGK